MENNSNNAEVFNNEIESMLREAPRAAPFYGLPVTPKNSNPVGRAPVLSTAPVRSNRKFASFKSPINSKNL